MTISAVILLSIFLGLFGVLLSIALVHLIQGMRYGGMSGAMATTSMLFLFGIFLVTVATWMLLRHVDWSVPFVIHLPFISSTQPS